MVTSKKPEKIILGWREWVSLPELGIEYLKAKIDTGARTSALHAFEVDTFQEKNKLKVKFSIHPKQGDTSKILTCVADLVDIRWITDSSGNREERYVIKTPIRIGSKTWPIEITLTSRDNMRFRMLLGRTALRDKFIVDLSASYLLGKKLKK